MIADRAEKAAVIVTTNLPFSEWPQVIPNPRLCKALIDRLTDRAHIVTPGTDSYRFRRTNAAVCSCHHVVPSRDRDHRQHHRAFNNGSHL